MEMTLDDLEPFAFDFAKHVLFPLSIFFFLISGHAKLTQFLCIQVNTVILIADSSSLAVQTAFKSYDISFLTPAPTYYRALPSFRYEVSNHPLKIVFKLSIH